MKWLTKESRDFLSRGYVINGQSVEDRIKYITDYAESILKIDGFSKKFYDYMSKGWYSLSTPVWCNFGLTRGLPISCYSSYIPDTMDGILNTAAEIGMMSKYGGGTSAYFGKVRGRGRPITDNGESSGSVHFMQLFDKLISIASQGSSRRGSCAVYQDIEHDDILEFLEIRKEGNPIQNLLSGVCVGDEWMNSMINGDINKRNIWAKVLESRSENGIPYLFFRDNANNNKPQVYKDKGLQIYNSNLCVAPETLVLTDKGYLPIQDLQDQEVEVWNGEEWSKTTVRKTSDYSRLLNVETDCGYTIDCTPYHKFYIIERYNKPYKMVEAKDLQPGDRLCKFDLPVISGDKELKNAYVNGFYSGDGCELGDKQRIYLYGEKRKLAHLFTGGIDEWYIQEDQDRQQKHYRDLKTKFFVPCNNYTIESRLEWLSGVLDSDGTIYRNGENEAFAISSVNLSFLQDIQMMLQTLGVSSKIKLMVEEGYRLLPANDGSGELKRFWCETAYRLLITSYDSYRLLSLGLKVHRLQIKIRQPQRDAKQFVKITSVSDLGRYDETYCFTEPKRNMGMFNGILTGNCNEIYLPTNEDESFVCCLSSINLVHYDEWKNTDAIETLTMFLDAVMEDFIIKSKEIPFLKRAYNFAKKHRALGMGVLGWHSLLQSKMIPIESMEAYSLNNEIFKLIDYKSTEASMFMAKVKGEPEIMEGYGLRNSTRLAIAPTTSSAFILGQVSQSIEPFRSNYYIKELAKIKYVCKNNYLENLLKYKNKDKKEVWDSIMKRDGSVQHLDFLSDEEKRVFKTFNEISQLELIQQAAQRQKYIDQGQSLNIIIHPKTPIKEVNKLIISAWELGLKGLYYQHSMNAAQIFNQKLMLCSSCEG